MKKKEDRGFLETKELHADCGQTAEGRKQLRAVTDKLRADCRQTAGGLRTDDLVRIRFCRSSAFREVIGKALFY